MRKRILSALVCAALLLSSWPVLAAQAEPYVVNHDGEPVTCRAFLARVDMELEGDEQAVLLDGEEEIPPDAYVATGQTLEIRNVFGQTVSSRPVAVVGDVTGSGKAGLPQLVRLARALSGQEPLEGVWALAADIDGSGSLGIGDLVAAARQAAAVSEGDAADLTSETLDLYLATPEDSQPQELVFADGDRDIPYLSMASAINLFETLYEIEIDATAEDGVYLLERENGTAAELNFRDDTILFTDYNDFFRQPYQSTILDPTQEDAEFLERSAGSFQRYGKAISVDVGTYGIEMYWQDGEGYLPLQTFGDIFGSPAQLQFLYNGEAAFVVAGGSLESLSDLFYAAAPRPRGEALAQFTYDQLCLTLDMFYGLREEHDISSFDELFIQTGLKEKLLSADATEAGSAIQDLTLGYLGDLHSAFISPSWYAGADAQPRPSMIADSVLESVEQGRRFAQARAEFYPEGVPTYEEVGNTAYVTFDSFTAQFSEPYADRPLTPDSDDTIDIIRYAHSQIMREDSPIENVVIDLSNNGGGTVDAALVVTSWYLGTTVLNLNDSCTEAQASTRYRADVNLDGAFDENDTVSSKNLYCLTSPNSFSCGNLVPAILKSSNRVTMLGKDSGGGACVVFPMSMADGTLLQVSGPDRISTVVNGSFYDVDRGVQVDVPITRIENFYDREALTGFIDGLFR